ncbi:MAG: C4-dicarboxylate ABC transporter, partial [Betaproteobacteria bacterium]|nr:C4-dicarboxylate ABC transporter [Betaproteobacteria bacterium]
MNDSSAMPSSTASASQLAHLSVVWFVPVMGWAGLALAWR